MFIGIGIFFVLVFLIFVLLYIVLAKLVNISLFFFPCSLALGSKEFLVVLDYISLSCILMLLVCSLMAFIYCFHYFSGGIDGLSLFYLMLIFVGVMLNLLVTGSLMYTLILWEYLGLVSFFLILFYSNSMSVRASLITLFSSRFGDVGLFVMLVWLCGCGDLTYLFFFFFFLVVVTKSAGFPFISWLLEAMRAPTPVSSLVHSSTLVVAGVWFLIRYGADLCYDFLFFLFLCSILTIFVTGFCAIFFLDLKKVVALSTCNNVSWCVVYYVCGDLDLVLCQLVVHGLSKCVLFILVGDLMSSSGSSQSGFGVYLPRYVGLWGVFLLVFSVFGLCGLPFLGVYFVKHCFFSFVGGLCYSLVSVVLVLFGFFLSYSYSFRLVMLLCSGSCGLSFGYIVSFVFLGMFSFLGTLVGYFLVGSLTESFSLGLFWSFILLLVQFSGFWFGYFCFIKGLSGGFWSEFVGNNDCLVGFFYGFYSFLGYFFWIVVYRWEVLFLGLFSRFFLGVFSVSLWSFSLNVVVLGLFYYFLFGYFF